MIIIYGSFKKLNPPKIINDEGISMSISISLFLLFISSWQVSLFTLYEVLFWFLECDTVLFYDKIELRGMPTFVRNTFPYKRKIFLHMQDVMLMDKICKHLLAKEFQQTLTTSFVTVFVLVPIQGPIQNIFQNIIVMS